MFWQRSKRTAPQAFISAIYGFGDILAGTILWAYFPTNIIWASMLYPPVIGARGAISGSFVGRLTSALNVGTVKPNLSRENEKLWEILSTTITASLLASVISPLPLLLLGGGISYLKLFFVSLIAISGVALILLPLKILVSFESFKRGLDPDIVVYPLTSTAADIVVTLLYIYAIRYANSIIEMMVALIILAISIIIILFWFSRGFIRILTEILAATIIVVGIESLTGAFLGEAVSISDPRILLIYPAMLTELGDASSIVGSILTTRFFLGMIKSKILLGDVIPEVVSIFGTFLGFFSLMGGILWFMGGNPLVSIITFLIAFPLMLLITTLIVVITSRKLDPDNFTIPISTSLADLITTAAISSVLALLG